MQRGRSSSPGRQLSGSWSGTPREGTFDSQPGVLDASGASRFTTPGLQAPPSVSVAPPSVTVAPPSSPIYVRDLSGTATSSHWGDVSEGSRAPSVASVRLPAGGPPTTTSSLSRSMPGQIDASGLSSRPEWPVAAPARPVMTTVFQDPYPSPASPNAIVGSPWRSEGEVRWASHTQSSQPQAMDVDLSRKPWVFPQQSSADFKTVAPKPFPTTSAARSPTPPSSFAAPPNVYTTTYSTYAAPPPTRQASAPKYSTYAAPPPTRQASAPKAATWTESSFSNEWKYCDMDRIDIYRMESDMLRFKHGQLDERLSVLEHLADSLVPDSELYERVHENEEKELGSYDSKEFGFKYGTVPILPEAMATIPPHKRNVELDNCIGHWVDRHRIEARESQLESLSMKNENHPWLLWLAGKSTRNLCNAKYHIATKSWRQSETFREMYEDGRNPVTVR